MPTTKYPVCETYDETRSTVLRLCGLPEERIDEAATELQLDFEIFAQEYDGPHLPNPHEYFALLLHEWPTPWDASSLSALNGLTVAQFYLCWAWNQNEIARWFAGEEAKRATTPDIAAERGAKAADSARKSIAHARALAAAGCRDLAQSALHS